MKKYNPIYHHNVPANIRRTAKAKGVDTSTYTDEEIYNIFSYWYGVEDNEDDKFTIDDIRNGVKREKA